MADNRNAPGGIPLTNRNRARRSRQVRSDRARATRRVADRMAPPSPDSYRRELSIGYRPAPAPYVGIKPSTAPRRYYHGSTRRW